MLSNKSALLSNQPSSLSGQPSATLTVSQLNRQVKQLLETQYPAIPVRGEISTLSRPASGHIYFTLKDANAQIRCAMFRSQLANNKYSPKQGDEVVVFGRLSLYEGRGDYQLIATAMQPIGDGALQTAFFQLKERLAAEGLFDEAHKKPLPADIQRVGIVTSATGAALHDILTVLERRFPALEVILYPTQVQGNEAAATLVQAIECANARNEVDILIVGRGGGSLEDLWCFNTEPVVRAIYHSVLPIISAVGHEVDVSIADFVADIRAATPSQAAELVSPDQYELMQRLDQGEQRLLSAISRLIRNQGQLLVSLSKRLKNPAVTVQEGFATLSGLQVRLNRAIARPLLQHQQQLDGLQRRLGQVSPQLTIERDRRMLMQSEQRLQRALDGTLERKKGRFQQLIGKLNLLSPLATLERGYSITRDSEGTVIQQSHQVQVGGEIETLLKDGKIISIVERIL